MTLDFSWRSSTTLAASARDDAPVLERRSWWVIPLLVIVTVLAYLPGMDAPFTFDDFSSIVQNSAIRSPARAWQSASSRRFGYLTFAWNYQYDGNNLVSFHAVNLAIHVAAGLTLFGLARRTFGLPGMRDALRQRATMLAAAIALLWLVHPLQTQAVTYIVQRFESLMGLLFLVAIYGLLRGATGQHGWPWYGLSLVASWLGLETKEAMVVLPLVALAYDRIFLAESWRQLCQRRWWVHLGMAILAARLIVESRGAFDSSKISTAGFGVATTTPWQYLCSQAGVIVHYLRLAVWPDVLCFDYRWPVADAWLAIVFPGLVIVGLLAVSGWGLWRYPRLGFLGVTFFLLLAVTSSVMPIDDLAVEHRMYLPLACVVALLVLGVDAAISQTLRDATARRWLRVGLLSMAVVGLSLRTSDRNRDYAEPIRLWTKALAVNPHNDRGHNYLGLAQQDRGRFDEAERHFLQSIEINPSSYMARTHLGMLKAQQGQVDEAIHWYEEALLLRPNFVKALILFGNLRTRARQYDQAVSLYRRATRALPDNAEAWMRLGTAYISTGDETQANATLRTAIRLHPRSDLTAGRLAWVLATADSSDIRNDQEALKIAERLAEKTQRRDYGVLEILAAAQASAGRFAEAGSTAEVAVSLAELAQDDAHQKLLESHLARYRAGQTVDMKSLFPANPRNPKTEH